MVALNLEALSDDELRALQAHLERTIAARKDGGEVKAEAGQGWLEIKKIGGHRYQYRRWYEGGRKRSRYIGKAE